MIMIILMCVCLQYNEMGTEEFIWADTLLVFFVHYTFVYSDLFLITQKKKQIYATFPSKREKAKTDTIATPRQLTRLDTDHNVHLHNQT